MNRRSFAGSLAAISFAPAQQAPSGGRPNVLWILAEDLGPQLACYGYPLVRTPNIDRLASQGVRFAHSATTAPVCSASRSGFQVGAYQTTTGAHHHRSHRGDGYQLPDGHMLISHRLGRLGYYTMNIRRGMAGVDGTGKTDFNFAAGKPFDGDDWSARPKDRPFFAQINLKETHKGPAFVEARQQKNLISPDKVPLPPYYPDHPVVRDEFANYLDTVNLLDKKVGAILQALEESGAASNTVVFFMGDNGRCLLRGKQWCYSAGVHVPMIVRWPGVAKAGTVRPDPVLSLDMTATTLWAAGGEIPRSMYGRPLFGPAARPREWAATARDRCDMTLDRIRSIRTTRYNYIRNFMPERPYTQWNQYIENSYPTLGVMLKLQKEGKLNAAQSLFMAARKPDEELYDLQADPHEVNNLAASPAHASVMAEMRRRLDTWLAETKDQGASPEPLSPEEADRRSRGGAPGKKGR